MYRSICVIVNYGFDLRKRMGKIQPKFGSVQLHVLKLYKELHVWYNKQYKWSADSLWNCLLIYIDCLTLLLMPLFYLRRIINSHDVNIFDW